MKSNVVTFNDDDILSITKDFPKSMKALEEFLGDIFKGAGEPVEIDEGMRNSILFFQPRLLYDFFDKQGVKTWVSYQNDKWFAHAVNKPNTLKNNTSFDIRIDAERTAFLQAFKLSEESASQAS